MRKKCIKFLTFFIISLLSCVLFSADTSAITLTTELMPTGTAFENPAVSCVIMNGNWYNANNTWTCPNSSYPNNWDGDTYGIRTQNTFPVQEGYYYQIHLILRNRNLNAVRLSPIFWNFNQSSDFTPVSLEAFYEDNSSTFQYCTYSYSGTNITGSSCNSNEVVYNSIFVYTVRASSTGNVRFQVGAAGGVLVAANLSGTLGPSNYNYTFGLKKVVEFKPSGAASLDQKDDEDRENIESQSSTASSDSESSAEDAESAGTTILGAFSAFVQALTSASPSTCVLDMDLGNLDMGNVDFCELDPPAGFTTLASIFLILFCVPLSIATARKIINLFRSFQ